MPHTDEQWWKPVWDFLIKTLTGVLIFGIIAAAAVGLNLLEHTLEKTAVDRAIIYGLCAAEYALFFTDVILFIRFLWVTMRRTWKKL